jgi:hypothetical protein
VAAPLMYHVGSGAAKVWTPPPQIGTPPPRLGPPQIGTPPPEIGTPPLPPSHTVSREFNHPRLAHVHDMAFVCLLSGL